MSSNEMMSLALSCKNCEHYRYACTCGKFESAAPETLKQLEESDDSDEGVEESR